MVISAKCLGCKRSRPRRSVTDVVFMCLISSLTYLLSYLLRGSARHFLSAEILSTTAQSEDKSYLQKPWNRLMTLKVTQWHGNCRLGQTDRQADRHQAFVLRFTLSTRLANITNLCSASSSRLSTWHCPHLLLSAVLRRRAAAPLLRSSRRPPLSIDIFCPRGAQQQTRRTPLLRSNDETDRRTDTVPSVPILSVFPALIVHSVLKNVHPGFPVAFIF